MTFASSARSCGADWIAFGGWITASNRVEGLQQFIASAPDGKPPWHKSLRIKSLIQAEYTIDIPRNASRMSSMNQHKTGVVAEAIAICKSLPEDGGSYASEPWYVTRSEGSTC